MCGWVTNLIELGSFVLVLNFDRCVYLCILKFWNTFTWLQSQTIRRKITLLSLPLPHKLPFFSFSFWLILPLFLIENRHTYVKVTNYKHFSGSPFWKTKQYTLKISPIPCLPPSALCPVVRMPYALFNTPPRMVTTGKFLIFCFYKQCCREWLVHVSFCIFATVSLG